MILGELMDVTYVYTVEVMGCDFIDSEWSDEHEFVCDIHFDTEKEAVDFLFGITKEQALEWERRSRCNGLDVVIFADPVMDDGTYELGFHVVGEYEWIGADRNLRDVWKAADVSNLGR